MTTDAPRFSVTVPAYNAERTLAQTLESVLAQTFADWEVVVVDDGSGDGTRTVAERFAAMDARVRAITQENCGSGGAYNTAVRHSHGDLVVMLSADDRLLPGHLAAFDELVRSSPQASVFTSGGWYELDDGTREPATPEARWADPTGCTLEELLEACFYGVGAVYRRDVFEVVGGFREGIYAEDYLFWLLALAHGFRHRHIAAPLSVHRRSGTQKSADAILMRETDLRVMSEIMESGLLSPAQLAAARRSAARLRRVIAARRILQKTMRAETLERLAAHRRSRRTAALSSRAPRPGSIGVTFINNFPGPSLGGGEIQLLALLCGLSSAGVRTTVVCAAGSALEGRARALDGVRVVPADFAPSALPCLVSAVSGRLPAGEIVQGTGFLTNLLARCVGGCAGVPVVNAVHVVPGATRLDGARRGNAALRAAFDRVSRRYVTRYVAVSQAVRAGLVADGVPSGLIAVIPNGIDLARLRKEASAACRVTNVPGGGRIGCVGRLERVKGTEHFLRAAALLAARHPEVRYVVAGCGSRERELRALADRLGMAGLVEFTGYVDSAPCLIATLDVVVVPSLSEAAGLTAMEAMALGVPVIASCVGGLTEVVDNGKTGLLVAPADPEAIAHAIARLLDDSELAHRLAAAGRRRADRVFGVASMAEAYLTVYKELSSRRTQRSRRQVALSGTRRIQKLPLKKGCTSGS